ncbi:MAG TPA: hypothetical protein ENI23_02615 [bacterium]|nr:hypothetical protein [bacterium]
MEKIKLGQEVKDKITGYTGIAVSRTHFFQGCDRIGVQLREVVENKTIDPETFDEPDLEIVSEGILPIEKPKSTSPGARIKTKFR